MDAQEEGGEMMTDDLGPTAANSPPRLLENEAYVLGSMMADEVLLHQARQVLKGDDFASERNRFVFEVLGDLCDRSASCEARLGWVRSGHS